MAERDGILTVSMLDTEKPTKFDTRPDQAMLDAMAGELGVTALRKVRLAGQISPVGKHDWRLDAEMGATVVQPCVVTLAPVTTRLDESVARTFLAHMPEPETGEVEMPEDDSIEPLEDVIDLTKVLAEAVALALPAYPRAEGVESVDASAAPPGAAPIDAAEENPFAALKGLRDKMGGDEG